MGSKKFIEMCKDEVLDYVKTHYPETHSHLDMDDIYIVWYCKTLQNHKALLSDTVDGDGLYFELTYNGDKAELYFDEYKKNHNEAIKLKY
jgi:hypothetical protein